MATLTVPRQWSQYEYNCLDEVETSVYGRDNRQPIHDAINYSVGMTQLMHIWCEAIGLCVEDGKLCVIYGGGQ